MRVRSDLIARTNSAVHWSDVKTDVGSRFVSNDGVNLVQRVVKECVDLICRQLRVLLLERLRIVTGLVVGEPRLDAAAYQQRCANEPHEDEQVLPHQWRTRPQAPPSGGSELAFIWRGVYASHDKMA